jgi:hypothetical protein
MAEAAYHLVARKKREREDRAGDQLSLQKHTPKDLLLSARPYLLKAAPLPRAHKWINPFLRSEPS